MLFFGFVGLGQIIQNKGLKGGFGGILHRPGMMTTVDMKVELDPVPFLGKTASSNL